HSFRAQVKIAQHSSTQDFLMCNSSFENFRAAVTKAAYDAETQSVMIAPDVADALLVEEGDFVRLLPQ
ncbi:arginine N-succinyltransferase, partial [Vibrio diabolicus]